MNKQNLYIFSAILSKIFLIFCSLILYCLVACVSVVEFELQSSFRNNDVAVSIPISIDGNDASLKIKRGSNWEHQVFEFLNFYGLSKLDGETLHASILYHERASQSCLQNKYVIIILTIEEMSDFFSIDHSEKFKTGLEAQVNAITSHLSGKKAEGAVLMLVTPGFSLCEKTIQKLKLVLRDLGWQKLMLLPFSEFQGYSFTLNQVLAFVPEHSIVVVHTVGVSLWLKATDQIFFFDDVSEDVFLAYEALSGAYGKRGALAAVVGRPLEMGLDPVSGCSLAEVASLPLLVFDSSTWDAVGKFDERYMFQGGVAEWLERANRINALVAPADWKTQFVKYNTRGKHRNVQEFVFLDASTTVTCQKLQKAAQEDMDMFYLQFIYEQDQGFVISDCSKQRLQFHSNLFGNVISPDLLDRSWRHKLRIGAVVIVYDDSRFLHHCLEDVIPRVQHVTILLGTKPWNGAPRNNSETYFHILKLLDHYKDSFQHKLSVVTGAWTSEAEQRNMGLGLLSALPGDLTHALMLDTDELYNPVQLERMFITSHLNSDFLYVLVPQTTFWKSVHIAIEPPEDLLVLTLVDLRKCKAKIARKLECLVHNQDIEAPLLLTKELVTCQHLSYSRTDEELLHKVTSFSHADEVQPKWYEDVWVKWDSQNDLQNLHPTNPKAYERTVQVPLHLLHPSIRRDFLSRQSSCQAQTVEEWSPEQKLFCYRIFQKMIQIPEEICWHLDLNIVPLLRPEKTVELDCGNTSERENKFEWEFVEGNTYQNRLEVHEILEKGLINLDPDDNNDLCPLRFMILIICEGEIDTSTEGVFKDVALIISSGLQRLGYDVITKTCYDFRFCMDSGNRIKVILGAHHLGRYEIDHLNSTIPLMLLTGWPPPDKTVLYNFEHVAHQVDFSSLWTLKIFKIFSPNIWDYSESNIEHLAELGISAEYVPLGYVNELEYLDRDQEEDIDVLFYGRLNEHRQLVLNTLRLHGINVLHANKYGSVFGQKLDALIQRSKIILNLHYFHDENEWKMTRFVRPLANSKLIVSERCGSQQEIWNWKAGVQFVDTIDEMVTTIKKYLVFENDRQLFASQGYHLFKQMKEEMYLSKVVEKLKTTLCPS